jgi:hypothetical protein
LAGTVCVPPSGRERLSSQISSASPGRRAGDPSVTVGEELVEVFGARLREGGTWRVVIDIENAVRASSGSALMAMSPRITLIR